MFNEVEEVKIPILEMAENREESDDHSPLSQINDQSSQNATSKYFSPVKGGESLYNFSNMISNQNLDDEELANMFKRCKNIGIDIPSLEYIPDLK